VKAVDAYINFLCRPRDAFLMTFKGNTVFGSAPTIPEHVNDVCDFKIVANDLI